MTRTQWPTSPFTAAHRTFRLLIRTGLQFDARGHAGLPQRPIPLDLLARLLLKPEVTPPVRDAVWRQLVRLARTDGPNRHSWVMACVGVALPGLRRAAGQLARGWHGDTGDIDAEMLIAFVARLDSLDLAGPRVVGRLLDAAIRAGKKARSQAARADAPHTEGAWSRAPLQPWGHPDFVLARARARAVIDRDEWRLIAATRLEHLPLADVAAELGLEVDLAADWRRKAELRLADAISVGELDYADLDVTRRKRQQRFGQERERALAAFARAYRRTALAAAG